MNKGLVHGFHKEFIIPIQFTMKFAVSLCEGTIPTTQKECYLPQVRIRLSPTSERNRRRCFQNCESRLLILLRALAPPRPNGVRAHKNTPQRTPPPKLFDTHEGLAQGAGHVRSRPPGKTGPHVTHSTTRGGGRAIDLGYFFMPRRPCGLK